MMDLLLMGVMAGIVGTLVMDSVNAVLARTGLLLKIDIEALGRMSAGWVRGRFCYHDPGEMERVERGLLLGYVTHYSISVLFALVYVLGWRALVGGPVSALWALGYGLATTAASQFLVFPSMGLGIFGRRSPEGIKAPLSSLANHSFFGLGMALVIALW